LEVLVPIGRGNNSLVLRCRRTGGRLAMLKLSPDTEIAAAEASALQTWASSGGVPAVWAYDAAAGALLLEAIPNEVPLSEDGGKVRLAEVVTLVNGLHVARSPVEAQDVPLTDRVEFIFDLWAERSVRAPGVTDLVPLARLYRGRELARRLVGDPGTPVLLHGDLHPGNVLNGGRPRGLVAIDPRPCVGEAAFDVVDWVFWRTRAQSWESRSQELASRLGIEHGRVWAWCSALAAMLAAGKAERGDKPDEIEALLALAP
jgi:streptomycin 6-kinase